MNNSSLKIFVGTYNLAEQEISIGDLRKWLIPNECETRCDLYSIGVQEGPKRCCFQPIISAGYREKWESSLVQVLGEDEFEILYGVSFGVQHLAILIRTSLKQFVEGTIMHSTVSVRIMSRKRRTKGAIIVFLHYRGLKITFVSCHLRYGVSYKPRQEDFVKIYERLKHFNDTGDFIFWSGDVNSRFDKLTYDQIRNFLTSYNLDFKHLLQYDQLHTELKNGGLMFKGFIESEINFLPTYKFLINSNAIHISRNPGYADRILYRVRPNCKHLLNVIKYDSVPIVCSSDHKPVYCLFEIIQSIN